MDDFSKPQLLLLSKGDHGAALTSLLEGFHCIDFNEVIRLEAEQPCVVVDLDQPHHASFSKQKTQRQVLQGANRTFITERTNPLDNAPYATTLSPLERLQSLLLSPQCNLADFYAEHLQQYIKHTTAPSHDADERFRNFVDGAASHLGNVDNTKVIQAWADAVNHLGELGRIRPLYDLNIAIVHEAHRSLALEAACCVMRHMPNAGDFNRQNPLLFIFTRTESMPSSLSDISGFALAPNNTGELLLAELESNLPSDINIEDVKVEKTLRCYIRSDSATQLVISQQNFWFNETLANLFNHLLVYGRPLRHYGCTFFLPLDLNMGNANRGRMARVLDQLPHVTHYRYRAYSGNQSLKNPVSAKSVHDDNNQRAAGDTKYCFYFSPILRDAILKAGTIKDDSTQECMGPVSLEQALKWRCRKLVVENSILDKKKIGLQSEAQAYLYFSPTLRDVMYEVGVLDGDSTTLNRSSCELQPIREWRLNKLVTKESLLALDECALTLGHGTENDADPFSSISGAIQSVRLYGYFNDCFLLAIRVTPQVLNHLDQQQASLLASNSDWWQALVFSSTSAFNTLRKLQMAVWMHYTRLARNLYPTYSEQAKENKIGPLKLTQHGKNLGDPFEVEETIELAVPARPYQILSGPVRYLIEHFFKHPNGYIYSDVYQKLKNSRDFSDDRMFVNVAYGLAGSPCDEDALKRMFSLALYVDRPSDGWSAFNGYAYNQAETERRVEARELKLWQGLYGQNYGYTEFSNIYLGYGYHFNEVTAPKHIPYLYERMLIMTLFYQASMQHYERRITAQTSEEINNKKSHAFQDLRAEFIQFTNQYWFHEVNNQMQGLDIFRLQQESLRLDSSYEFLKEEMERADEFSQTKGNLRLQRAAHNLTLIGATLAFPAVLYPLIQLLVATTASGEMQNYNVDMLLQRAGELWPLTFAPILIWAIIIILLINRKTQ